MAKMYFITEEWNESDKFPHGTTLSGLMNLCIRHLRFMKKSLSFWKTKIIVTKTY